MSYWTAAGNLCFVLGVVAGIGAIGMLSWSLKRRHDKRRPKWIVCNGCRGEFSMLVPYDGTRLCYDCHERQTEIDSWDVQKRRDVRELENLLRSGGE